MSGLGPLATSLPDLPAMPFVGVVLANELLDNLPFRIVERAGGRWLEIRVGEAGTEVPVPADEALSAEADALVGTLPVPDGARLPIQTAMRVWLAEVAAVLRKGTVAIIDYAASTGELLSRSQDGWLRTYRAHGRGGPPLEAPGTQDITADVCVEALRRSTTRAGLTVVEETSQADWLRSLGVGSLVDEARAAWSARTANDLEALKARSLVHEAAALLDPDGLGAHRVVILEKR